MDNVRSQFPVCYGGVGCYYAVTQFYNFRYTPVITRGWFHTLCHFTVPYGCHTLITGRSPRSRCPPPHMILLLVSDDNLPSFVNTLLSHSSVRMLVLVTFPTPPPVSPRLQFATTLLHAVGGGWFVLYYTRLYSPNYTHYFGLSPLLHFGSVLLLACHIWFGYVCCLVFIYTLHTVTHALLHHIWTIPGCALRAQRSRTVPWVVVLLR